MNNLNRGFTLIELLVVIAIIGILSSVVLSALNQSRGKGIDAAIKRNLANARSQAALFYENNSETFSGGSGPANVCSNTVASDNVTKSVQGFAQAAATAGGYTLSTNFAGPTTPTNVSCQANATTWAIQSPLKTGGYWCVDYTGASKFEAAVMAGSQGRCA